MDMIHDAVRIKTPDRLGETAILHVNSNRQNDDESFLLILSSIF